MELKKIGVLGAGVMGVGVAQDLAQHGHRVVLIDLTEEILERARAEIRQNVRLQAMISHAPTAQASPSPAPKKKKAGEVLEAITFTTDVALLADVDFVIENVTERWDVKEKIYRQIDPICPAHAVFGVNTSAISITRVGSVTRRPEKIVGMHFMNPVPLKSTVEVIRGFHTTEETIATAQALLATCGKEGIVVRDMPGFVSNRVLMLTINEAIFLVQDQVASAEDVDRIFKSCFGHKMGPLETGDLIGLDTILDSLIVLYESYNDDKFRPAPLLKTMVYAGLLGRKSGKGFYNYQPE